MANIFDLEGARSAGASDTQIADFLANKLNFDLAGAREAGASDSQITDFLATKTAPKPKEELPAQPKEATAGGELLAGGERYASSYKTAVDAFTGDPVAAARAGEARQKDIVQRYGQARGLDETRRAYEERGLLGAGAEVASQVPAALTGQGANLAVMGAAAAAGAPGGPITAALAAISTQVVPFFEQNLIAQLRAQEARGETPDLNRAKAAAYAVVQSSAEVGGTVLAFGKRLIGGIIGSKPAAEATEALVKTAQQSLLVASGKGAVRATGAEIPVEMAQTILQRHQAGESLTDDDALEDYKNTIYGTILVAGPLGAGAGPVNRMQARSELDRRELAKTQTEKTDGELADAGKEQTQDQTEQEVADIEKKLAGINAIPTDFEDIDGTDSIGTTPAPVVNAELQAMEAEYAKREEDIKTGPKKAVPNRIKKNAELKLKIEAKRAELAQAAAAPPVTPPVTPPAPADQSYVPGTPPVTPPAPIVQGDQNVAGQSVAGGVGAGTTVSGQPGGVPTGGVGGVDGTGVAVVGDTGAPPQAGTAGQPGTLTPAVTTPIAEGVGARKATPTEQKAIDYIDAIDTKGASFSPAQAKKVAASVGIQLPKSTKKNPVTLQDINQIIRNYVSNLKPVLAGRVREVAPNVFEGTATTADVIKTEERVTPRQKDTSEDVERQSIAKGLAQDRAEETARDTALTETKGQKLPPVKLPDIENFLEEYDLARADLAEQDVEVPEWNNLKTDEKDFFLSQLPTNPSATDYTDALENLADYKEGTGRGEGYGGKKATPTQRRIINGYNEARAEAYKKYNVNFPQWDSLSPEAQKAYSDIVTSNAPSQQDAGLQAVQQVLQTQGISVNSTERQQLKKNEEDSRAKAQTRMEQERREAEEAVGRGKMLSEKNGTKDVLDAILAGDINGALRLLIKKANGLKLKPERHELLNSRPIRVYSEFAEQYSAKLFRSLALALDNINFGPTKNNPNGSKVVTDANNDTIKRLVKEKKLAEYDPKTDTFYFALQGVNKSIDEATFFHEVVHAATVRNINKFLTDPTSLDQAQREAMEHLQKIFDFAKSRLGGKFRNAFENLYEFVGYALTDSRFQNALGDIQSRALTKYSLPSMRNLWGNFTSAIAKLLGFAKPRAEKVLLNNEIAGNIIKDFRVAPDSQELFEMYADELIDGKTDANSFNEWSESKQSELKTEAGKAPKFKSKNLIGDTVPGYEGNLLMETSEIFNRILAKPEAGIDMSPLAASAAGAAGTTATPANKPTNMGPTKPESLFDDSLVETKDGKEGKYSVESFKPKSLLSRLAKTIMPSSLVTKFQNTKHLLKTLENQADLSDLIEYDGPNQNNSYTEATLSAERGSMNYKREALPHVVALETALDKLVKLTNSTIEKTVGKLGMLSIALHEGERRVVKFMKTAPLRPQMSDVRNQIFDLLESKTKLTQAQTDTLRNKLNSIMFEVDQNGKVKVGADGQPVVNKKNVTPLGFSPNGSTSLDVGDATYNVVDMDGASVKNLIDEYNKHPQKAAIDEVLSSLRKIEVGTQRMNSVSNYWSNPVSNIVAFYGWDNYVPMKARFEKDAFFDPMHRGRELQDAQSSFEGSDNTPDNPILQVMSDAARAASRSGRGNYTLTIKNAVLQGLIEGRVAKEPIKFKDRDNALPAAKKKNTIFHYNKDGTVDVIEIAKPEMLEALRRTYKDSNPLVDSMNMVTGFIGKMHTRWNYAFAPMNFIRDALTNAFVLGAEFGPADSARMIAKIASQVGVRGGLFKAMKVANMYENGDTKGMEAYAKKDPFVRDMVEYLNKGGAVSYTAGLSLKDKLQELNKELGRGKVIKNYEQFEKFVDVWNNMFEFSSRAAAYGIVKQRFMKQDKTKTEAQVSAKAVAYVKNLANFEQVGEHGKLMGALFMFFRPAATGAVRAIESVTPAFRSLNSAVKALPVKIKTDPVALAKFEKNYAKKQMNARIMIAALGGLGIFAYMMAATMAPEDDLGRNSVHADNMKTWNRYFRVHIPNEISEALGMGKNVVFQLPWGFGLGAFAASGAQIANAVSGKGTMEEALKNIFTDIALDSFIPLPVSKMEFSENPVNFMIDSLTPSIARPLLQFALNKDGLGRGIYNEPYRRMADAFSAGDRVPEAYKDAARYFFNEVGVDVNPNSMYFLANSYFDGVGRMLETSYGALGLSGEKPRNIKQESLLFGSFFGNKGNVDNREFAQIQSQLMKKQANLNAVKNDPTAYVKYLERNPMDEALVGMYLKDINGDLKKLQTEAKSIRMMPTEMLSPKDRQEMLEPNLLMQRLIKANLIEKYRAFGIKP